jgi:uncharacterized protein (DUF1778 family)
MPKENKTVYLKCRIRPSRKQEIQAAARAKGTKVSKLMDKAFDIILNQ